MMSKSFNLLSSNAILINASVILTVFSFRHLYAAVEVQMAAVWYMKAGVMLKWWFFIAVFFGIIYSFLEYHQRDISVWLKRLHLWLTAMSYTYLLFWVVQRATLQTLSSANIEVDSFGIFTMKGFILAGIVLAVSQVFFIANILRAFLVKKAETSSQIEDIDHLITDGEF